MNTNQALSVLHSWLKAVGIQSAPVEKQPTMLSVGGILIHVAGEGFVATGADVTVNGLKLLSTDRNEALAEFHSLTELLGEGKPDPFVRESAEGRSKDFDLTIMRHCEFRNAPNPSEADIKKYERVVDNCVKRFYVSNKLICFYSLIEEEDLKTYAMVWLCNFIHKYQLLNAPDLENFKLLNYHLQQRFTKLRADLWKRQGKVKPDIEAASLALGMGTECPQPQDEEESDYIPMKRTEAIVKLTQKLADLPHDQMIMVLKEVAESEHYSHCEDTKKMAAKLLKKHIENCQSCLALEG